MIAVDEKYRKRSIGETVGPGMYRRAGMEETLESHVPRPSAFSLSPPGLNLVRRAVLAMRDNGADEVGRVGPRVPPARYARLPSPFPSLPLLKPRLPPPPSNGL